MAENDRLARAPVLVEDLRFVGRGDRGHALPPLVRALTPMRPQWQRNECSCCAPAARLPSSHRRDGMTEVAASARVSVQARPDGNAHAALPTDTRPLRLADEPRRD